MLTRRELLKLGVYTAAASYFPRTTFSAGSLPPKKILILGGSVWRYGRRIKMVDGSPFADLRKPRAAKSPTSWTRARPGRNRNQAQKSCNLWDF